MSGNSHSFSYAVNYKIIPKSPHQEDISPDFRYCLIVIFKKMPLQNLNKYITVMKKSPDGFPSKVFRDIALNYQLKTSIKVTKLMSCHSFPASLILSSFSAF